MERREFVKMLGIGGLLVGAGVILGAGCPAEEEPEEPPMDPEAPIDDPADVAPPPEEMP